MSLSAAGAALQGHDYQHLVAWYHALRALRSNEDVSGIAVEAEDAGNVDDVVVRRADAPAEHYQVKYSVDGQNPIDHDWWITPPRKNGRSPLQRFWESWKLLSQRETNPVLRLYSNRPLDVSDPVLALQDGHTGKLGPRLRAEAPTSKAGRGLEKWASHLSTTREELLEMLDCLGMITGQSAWETFKTSVADRMAAVGLKSDDLDVEQGVQAIRSWVTSGTREISREMLWAEIERRKLRAESRQATLIVQAIDSEPWADGATASLDWVSLFDGNHPLERRQLRDPAQWNERLFPDLQRAEKRIRSMDFTRVLVRGAMRLPAWFATGIAFSDVRGVQVTCMQRDQRWSSDVPPTKVEVQLAACVELKAGDDLAVGVSVTNDLSTDVLEFLRSSGSPAARFVALVPSKGPSPRAIPDASCANGLALAIRELVREQVKQTRAKTIHLFLAAPAGLALLLGHVWSRLPRTQLYEDLKSGYAPTFTIPG